MAFADRVVIKRLLVERLRAQLALNSNESGVVFLAAQQEPEDEDTDKWCKVVRFAIKRNRRQKHPDASGSGGERNKGADTGTFVLVLGLVCRVQSVDDSDYAWDSAAGFVERAFDGAPMAYPASPSTPVHVVNAVEVEAVQDAGDDGENQMFTGVVTVTGNWSRATGDSLEVRPASL